MLVYIRALGALAHPDILSVMEPYLEGKYEATEFQRLAFVVSLGKLSQHYPKLARSIYFKIYQNSAERYEVRVAAIYGIMRTNPDAAMLQRMAEMANIEPSSHISAAVRSALETASDLEHSDDRELSENAEAARQLLDDEEEGVQYSRTSIQDWIMDEMNLAYKMQASHVGSEDSLIPKAYFWRVTKNMGGYKNRWNEYHAMISSVDQLVNHVRDAFKSDKNRNKNKHEEARKDNRFNFEQIENLLDIQADQREELEGQILMKFLNTKRMFTFNNQTIESLPKVIRRVAKQLQEAQTFNYTKFYNQEQITLGFPLACGMPFLYTYKTPTLARAGGEIRLSSSNQESHPTKARFYADIDALYATSVNARTGFISVTDNQRFVAGVHKKIQFRLPLRMKFDVDMEKNQVYSEMQMLEDHEITLFHASSTPYTQAQDIKAAFDSKAYVDFKRVSVDDTKLYNSRFGQKSTGMVLDITAKYEKEPISRDQVMEYLQSRDFVSLAMYATEIDSTEYYKFEVNTNRLSSTNDKVKIQFDFESKESYEDEEGARHPRDTQFKTQWKNDKLAQLRNDLYKLGSQWNNAEIDGVQCTLFFDGQKPAQFQANLVYGGSQVSNDQRWAFYAIGDGVSYNKEFYARGYLQKPNAPELNLEDALKPQDDGKMMIEAEYGAANDVKKSKLTIKAKLHQTEEYRQQLQKSDEVKECRRQMKQGNYAQYECRYIIHQAEVYDKYTITVDGENFSKKQKEAAHTAGSHVHSALAWALGAYKTQQSDDRKSDYVQCEIQLSPDFEFLNFTLKTPSREICYDYIPLPAEAVKSIACHPEKSAYERAAYYATDGAYEGEIFY